MTITPTRARRQSAQKRPDAQRQELTLAHRLSRLDVKASPYLYIAPFFILFALVGLFPLVYTFVVSL
ncbi:MAG: sugar ABC transporter permease, partial [Isosphaeraceae bacterium]